MAELALLICCWDSRSSGSIGKKVTQNVDQLEVVETPSLVHDPSRSTRQQRIAKLVQATLVPSSCIATVRLLRGNLEVGVAAIGL